jgi:predicted peroxiredoxin
VDTSAWPPITRSRQNAYAALMRVLYMATAGSSDPTRASIPLHLAVNGSLEVGHDVGVLLAGDATELLKAGVRDGLEGVGVPPVRDLLAKARQHEVPIYV